MGAAGEHHRSLVAVFLESIKKGAGKAEVALHEILRILRAVDSGKIEHEIALGAPLLELLRGTVKVVLEDLVYCEISVAPGLAGPYVIELGAKVLSYETLGSGYKYLHYFARLAIPLSSFWMYSRLAILALVSSRLRRRVLSELNSSMVTRLESPSVKNLS